MTQDLYYIESGYLTPDSGYYVYTADAESALSSAATMAVTAGVIKDCVSTIVCQTTVAAVISHIHGADLVAFSNAAIATQITVIRNNNVQLTSVFSAAIDAVRGIYVSAQADSAAAVSIANQRVRYTEAAHSAAFSLTADVSVISGVVIKEAAADLSSEFTQTTLGSKRQRFEIAQVVISNQNTQVERIRNSSAGISSQIIIVANVNRILQSSIDTNSQVTLSSSAERTRDTSVSVSSAFTPTLTVDVFKNSFAVLDSVASVAVQAMVKLGYQANLTSQSILITSSSIIKLANANLASQFNSAIIGIKPSRVVGDPTVISGAGYSDLTIDTTTKKFGAGSLRFHSRPSYVSNNTVYVAGNAAVSTSQKKFGAGSIFFDGVGDNINLDFDSDYYFETGNFTIELWIRPQSLVSSDVIFSLRNGPSTAPIPVLFLDNGVLKYANPNILRITGSTLQTNTWYHIALSRSGTSTRLFVDGTQVGSTYTDTSDYTTGRPVFGSDYQNSAGSNFHGFMDDIRISKGIARYTSNFTAPTAAHTPDSYTTLLIQADTNIADTSADWQTILDVPSVSYPDSNKWRTWKTLDFWLYITAGHPTNSGLYHRLVGQGLRGSDPYWGLYLQGASGASRIFGLSNVGGPFGSSPGFVGDFSDNQWNHIRFIYDGGNLALFVNGTKVYTWTSVNILDVAQPLLFGGDGAYIGDKGTGDVYYDEVLISDVALTNINDTTFTVPTSPYSNTVNTSLLLHFDSNFFDDASQIPKLLSAQATLVSTASQTSIAQKTASAVASLAATSTMTTVAAKNAEIILTAFGNASVATTINRLRSADSAQASSFAQTTIGSRTRFANSTQSSSFAQTAVAVKTVDSLITTDAIFTELAAVARTGAGFVQLDSVATMAVTAVKTARISDTFTSQFAQSTAAVKSITVSASISSQAALAAILLRIRNQVLVYAVNSQLEAVVGEIVQFNANLTAVAAAICETSRTQLFSIAITSQASVDSTILRIKDGSSSLAGEFTQTANTANSKTLVGTASLAIEATVTANAGIIKQAAITTDAIFTELVAVAKTGQGFITLDSPATLSAAITKTSGASAGIASQAAVVATIGKLQTANAAISSSATFTATGTFVTLANAHFSVTSTLVCNVVKTVGAISLEASAGTLTATARADKRATANLSVLAFELALGDKTASLSANLVSATNITARANAIFNNQVTMQGFASNLVVADIIHIDAKLTWMIFAEDRDYSISADTRTYSIVEEDRDYLIVQENREYAVTRELLTTELQGV